MGCSVIYRGLVVGAVYYRPGLPNCGVTDHADILCVDMIDDS